MCLLQSRRCYTTTINLASKITIKVDNNIRSSLFESSVLGLDNEEVAIYQLESEPAVVNDVVLPADALERDRVHILVENNSQ